MTKIRFLSRPASLRLIAIAASLALAATIAKADDAPDGNAKQVAGLFMQSCLEYAGDKDGLREWAKKDNLLELPAQAQDQFLHGLPGIVFDASNRVGKFVLVSEDGGSCSVIAEAANGSNVIADLEQDMNAAKIGFKVTNEKTDAEEKTLKHREYMATRGDQQWLLLVSTVKDTADGQAMLTANRF